MRIFGISFASSATRKKKSNQMWKAVAKWEEWRRRIPGSTNVRFEYLSLHFHKTPSTKKNLKEENTSEEDERVEEIKKTHHTRETDKQGITDEREKNYYLREECKQEEIKESTGRRQFSTQSWRRRNNMSRAAFRHISRRGV